MTGGGSVDIREAGCQDLSMLLELYTHLHDNKMPEIDEAVKDLWNGILNDQNYHIIVLTEKDMIASSCTLITVLNLTQGQRPYALIENVVTHPNYRRRGFASRTIEYAAEIAKKRDCYKIMLMTSAKDEDTLNFYMRAGYNMKDKTAFVKWL